MIEALVKAGAFDAIDARRAALFASVGIAIEAAERAEATAGQVSLFGEGARARTRFRSSTRVRGPTRSVSLTRRRHSASTCPAIRSMRIAAELKPLVKVSLANIQPRQERYLVAGIVTALRVQTGRRGKMAFVTLDDGKGSAEIIVYNETFDAARALLREDQLVVVEVRVLQRVGEDGDLQGLRIAAENVYDLAEVRKRWAKRLKLSFNGNADAGRLEDLLKPFRGDGVPVTVYYRQRPLRRRRRALRKLARGARSGADRPAARVARARERRSGLLTKQCPNPLCDRSPPHPRRCLTLSRFTPCVRSTTATPRSFGRPASRASSRSASSRGCRSGRSAFRRCCTCASSPARSRSPAASWVRSSSRPR